MVYFAWFSLFFQYLFLLIYFLSTCTTTPCAISVTYNGTGRENASFYIRLNRPEYPDTKLDFFSN